MNLLLTGDPGCGKTTAILRVVERLRGLRLSGFVTEEVVEGGSRVGFRGRTLDGTTFPLARQGAPGDLRVGPYAIDLSGLEAIGVPALSPDPGVRLIVLDEVGKMESFSAPFREAVERALASEVPVLGTVAAHGVGFPKRVRHDPRVTLLKMGRASRAWAVGEMLRTLERAGVKPPAAEGLRK